MRDSSGEIVCRGLSNDVTRKEAPTGVPDVPSKRRPHTLNNPSRFETKYSVFPPGPQCGLSSYASPSVMGVQRPPDAGIAKIVETPASLDSTATYYASVRVTIKPVAPEDLGEIEDWLSGDKDSEQSTGLPDYLLGLAVSLSGLGERTEMEKGPKFVPARLSAAPATTE